MSDQWQRQTFSRIQQASQSIPKGLSRRKMLLGGIGLTGVTVAMGSELEPTPRIINARIQARSWR